VPSGSTNLYRKKLDLWDRLGFAVHCNAEFASYSQWLHRARLKLFCIAANVIMLAFAIALMISIGQARTLANPQVPLVAGLILAQTAFSLGKNA
jgi:hypothetical protein